MEVHCPHNIQDRDLLQTFLGGAGWDCMYLISAKSREEFNL